MEQLSINDALDLMQSDMSLWEKAEKQFKGGGKHELTLNLPWGIGEYTVTLEGLHNAEGKRNAVSVYGNHIRGIIKDRIDDEAVTARARAVAAQREQADSADRDSVRRVQRVREQAVPTSAYEEAGEAYDQTSLPLVGSREALVAERAQIVKRVRAAEARLIELKRERRMIEAVIAIWEEEDAPKDSREASPSSEGEGSKDSPIQEA